MDFSNNLNDVKFPSVEKPETASPLDKLKQSESWDKSTHKTDDLEKLTFPEPWGEWSEAKRSDTFEQLETNSPLDKLEVPEKPWEKKDERVSEAENVFVPVNEDSRFKELIEKDNPLQISAIEERDDTNTNGTATNENVESESDSLNNERTELSSETKEKLSELGYPEDIIEKIKTEEEAKIYLDANLEPQEVNGRPCLVKKDIDPDRKDPVTGETNLEKMKRGRAPLDENGKPIELHHIGQNNDSPLAELTRDEHTGKGNYAILHERKESEIDRKGFEKEKSEHWKARAEQIESQQS